MNIYKLDHVQVAMPRGAEAEARAFYSDILELQEETKPESLAQRGGVWFKSGELRLHLGVEEAFKPAKKAHPALLVYDLTALIARLEQAGIAITNDDKLPGYKRIYIADPFGNRLELLQPLNL